MAELRLLAAPAPARSVTARRPGPGTDVGAHDHRFTSLAGDEGREARAGATGRARPAKRRQASGPLGAAWAVASVPQLTGQLATLVPLAPEHVPELLRILSTPEVRRYWGDERERPGWPFDDDSTRFAVMRADRVLGMVQFYEEDDLRYRHASLDIFLDPEVHNRGIGRDVVSTVARYLFDERGHHRVVIDPAADNDAAVRAYTAAGFRVVGTGTPKKGQGRARPRGKGLALALMVCATVFVDVAPAWARSAPSTSSPASAPWEEEAAPGAGGFSGVSCPTVSTCVAVGDVLSSSSTAAVPLVETWRSGQWASAQTSGAVEGGSLASVSCPSATACVAVGQSGGWPYSLVLRSGSWVAVHVPRPRHGTQGELSGVSCAKEKSCVAVGTWLDDATFRSGAVAYVFNGSSWTSAGLPGLPSGASLSAVACASGLANNQCTAVGSAIVGHVPAPLVVQRTGRKWAVEKVPKGPSGTPTSLGSVSCPTASACMAVGGGEVGSQPHPLVLLEKSGHWSKLAVPARAGIGVTMSASCPQVISWCAVAGEAGSNADRATIAIWAGHWRSQKVGPVPAPISLLKAVACTPYGKRQPKCTAVGSTLSSAAALDQPLVLRGS